MNNAAFGEGHAYLPLLREPRLREVTGLLQPSGMRHSAF
jgi:hypothetical protein